MKLRYVWREQTRDGRLLDPDETVEEALGYSGLRYRYFNGYFGHETEEGALAAYKNAELSLPSWALPSNLALIKVIMPGA